MSFLWNWKHYRPQYNPTTRKLKVDTKPVCALKNWDVIFCNLSAGSGFGLWEPGEVQFLGVDSDLNPIDGFPVTRVPESSHAIVNMVRVFLDCILVATNNGVFRLDLRGCVKQWYGEGINAHDIDLRYITNGRIIYAAHDYKDGRCVSGYDYTTGELVYEHAGNGTNAGSIRCSSYDEQNPNPRIVFTTSYTFEGYTCCKVWVTSMIGSTIWTYETQASISRYARGIVRFYPAALNVYVLTSYRIFHLSSSGSLVNYADIGIGGNGRAAHMSIDPTGYIYCGGGDPSGLPLSRIDIDLDPESIEDYTIDSVTDFCLAGEGGPIYVAKWVSFGYGDPYPVIRKLDADFNLLESYETVEMECWRCTPGGNIKVGDIFNIKVARGGLYGYYTISFTATAPTNENVVDGLVAAWNASTDPHLTNIVASKVDNKIVLTANSVFIWFYLYPSTTGPGGTPAQGQWFRYTAISWGLGMGWRFVGVKNPTGSISQ